MDFGSAPIVVYYHIPRTGGSTFWHTLTDSLVGESIDILDTYFKSLSIYGSALHEQEFFDEIVSTLTLNPRVVHVHSSIDFSKVPENTLIVHGVRSNWSWRKSWILHVLKNILAAYLTKQKAWQYSVPQRDDNNPQGFYNLFTADIYHYYDNPIIKNMQVKRFVHKLNDESILETIQLVREHLRADDKTLRIQRYKNSKTRNLEKHDSNGLMINVAGVFLCFVTYPLYLFNFYLQLLIPKLTRQKKTFLKPHETHQGKYEINELERKNIEKYGRDLIEQNAIVNPNFEICSNEVSIINEDHAACAENWYLNRDGEIIFRQFSRSLGRFYLQELETFAEIVNCDNKNTFFEIFQEINLQSLPIKFQGERCIFSFQLRIKGNLSKNERTYGLTSYSVDENKNLRLINTVHRIGSENEIIQSNWQKFVFVCRIPEDAKKLFVGILVQCPTGLDEGLVLNLKNMHLSLR